MMAKAPATSTAPEATEPCLRITAPGGSRWRAGLQFGRAPVDLGEADIEAAARAKGITPEDVIALLRADPHLAVVPHRRPIPEAEASPEA
ncbi:unknown protein [Azorhizobium caulinodans ORS 571]|uniref:Uncharacterized protein n=2 Tax=Azorhizobium caulinodans TaxID=7 RepID=A8I7Q9_AZOC5|nr:unknown protein [Azorhizobium caulinodans ORS 571]